MNKGWKIFHNWGYWLHIIIGVALFLQPLRFVRPHEEFRLDVYLLRASLPLSQFIVFYTNFLWLVPQLLIGKKQKFWLINIVLVFILAIGVHACMSYIWFIEHPHTIRPSWKPEPFFFLREVFNLAVAAGIATAVTMSRRWIQTENARQEAEAARTEAELSNLRSQINPHFLLNTLNNIYALTAFDTSKAQEAIMELSKMLRHVLYDNQAPLVNLSNEIVFLHNYVNLMRIRTPRNVEVTEEINIPDPCFIEVAPMIFISLIENAFKHGISPSEKSFIRILIIADEHQIICHIENTNHPKTRADRSGHGIGLQQVQRRLDLSYPVKYKWEKGISLDTQTYSSKITIYDTKLRNH